MILVVFVFLRNLRATLIPAVAVPVSLVATFGVMYLAGYSLNNLSLMALTVATGFVVDDAIVVLENVTRHIEAGHAPDGGRAARRARGGLHRGLDEPVADRGVHPDPASWAASSGALFREFAITLSVAILVSLLVSLTATPMMCARLLEAADRRAAAAGCYRASERVLRRRCCAATGAAWHGRCAIRSLVDPRARATIALNVYLYIDVPKGFFPQQDTGRLIGFIRADQSDLVPGDAAEARRASWRSCERPGGGERVAFTGGGQRNAGSMFIALKPLAERSRRREPGHRAPARSSSPRSRARSSSCNRCRTCGSAGGRATRTYQFTLQGDDLNELRTWTPRLEAALQQVPELADVNSDQQMSGLQTTLSIDRETAARLGITPRMIDSTLDLAFGQSVRSRRSTPQLQPVPRRDGGRRRGTGRAPRR